MIEIYQTPTGWRWRAKGKNGEIVASGEEYPTRRNAVRGVATVRKILSDPETEIKVIKNSFAHLKHDMEYADEQRNHEA